MIMQLLHILSMTKGWRAILMRWWSEEWQKTLVVGNRELISESLAPVKSFSNPFL